MKTVNDVVWALKRQDEVTVLELLDISSEDLVDRFGDFIEKRFNYLVKELDEEVGDAGSNPYTDPNWELSSLFGNDNEEDE